MSGHSKWSTIKHKKALGDAKKGSVFTKLAKKIYIAVKQGGGGDPDKNASLRMVLEEVKLANMPRDNVRRAIDRGLGIRENGDSMIEVCYEGYLSHGVGVIVTVLTDNRNRTGGEMKVLFERGGGSMGRPGSVAYLQNISPKVEVNVEKEDRTKLMEVLEKIKLMDETISVWTNLAEYE